MYDNDTIDTVWETDTERVRLVADYDGTYADPRDADNLGVMAAHGHRNYNLGDNTDLTQEVHEALLRVGPRITARWLRIFHGAIVVLPLGLIDHSGISMYVGAGAHFADPGGWDSGIVGLIFDTPERRAVCWGDDPADPEKIEAALRSEVEVYDQYLRGEVYGAVYEKRYVWTREDGETRREWEQEESVWGILGYDGAPEVARYYFPEPTEHEKSLAAEAAGLDALAAAE